MSLRADVLSIRSAIEQQLQEHAMSIRKQVQEQYASLAQEVREQQRIVEWTIERALVQHSQPQEHQIPCSEKENIKRDKVSSQTSDVQMRKTNSSGGPVGNRENGKAATGKANGSYGPGSLSPRGKSGGILRTPTRPAVSQAAARDIPAVIESPIRLGPTTFFRSAAGQNNVNVISETELESPQRVELSMQMTVQPAALLSALLSGNVGESLEVLAGDDLIQEHLRGLQGYTALRLAVEQGYTDVSDALVERMSSTDSGVSEWLQIAQDLGHSDVVAVLRPGATFGEENRDFWCYTALRLAAERGAVDVRDALLRYATCSETCKANWLRTAEDFGHDQVLDLLRATKPAEYVVEVQQITMTEDAQALQLDESAPGNSQAAPSRSAVRTWDFDGNTRIPTRMTWPRK